MPCSAFLALGSRASKSILKKADAVINFDRLYSFPQLNAPPGPAPQFALFHKVADGELFQNLYTMLDNILRLN